MRRTACCRTLAWAFASVVALATSVAACGDGRRPPGFSSPGDDAGPRPDTGPPHDAGLDAGMEDAGDPPLPVPDIEIVLPFGEPPQTIDLVYEALVRLLDLHVLVDTTGSMGDEIDELQRTLSGDVARDVAESVDDVTFGVSEFEDFPFDPFGGPSDLPFQLLQEQTSSLPAAQRAVSMLDDPLGFGGDFPESTAEALYQIATGEGITVNDVVLVEPHLPGRGERGGASFRAGALPVVLVATDERTHDAWEYDDTFPGAHSFEEAIEALVTIGARVVGIASGERARVTLEPAAMATEATMPPEDGDEEEGCPTGPDGDGRATFKPGLCPLVFDVNPDGSGLSDAAVGAIRALVETIVWQTVEIRVIGDDLGFVTSAEALSAEPPDGAPEPGRVDLSGDAVFDTFTDVYRGTRLTYRLTFENSRLRPTDYNQVFYLQSQLIGDGETVVDQKLIRVTVPAGPPPLPDAGADNDAGT